MLTITFEQFLEFIPLGDGSQADLAAQGLRDFLGSTVRSEQDLAELIDEARHKAGQGKAHFSKALQDLVNVAGRFLGFSVEFGRYQGGGPGDVGFDGLWQLVTTPKGHMSKTLWSIVVETRMSTTHQIAPRTLLGYMDQLAQAGKVEAQHTMGLYVVAKGSTIALENQIRGAGYDQKIRVISADDLLDLVLLREQAQLQAADVRELMWPVETVNIGAILRVIRLISSGAITGSPTQNGGAAPSVTSAAGPGAVTSAMTSSHYLLPAADADDATKAVQNLHRSPNEVLWGLGERTAGPKRFRPGDWLCGYVTSPQQAVVSKAEVAGPSALLDS